MSGKPSVLMPLEPADYLHSSIRLVLVLALSSYLFLFFLSDLRDLLPLNPHSPGPFFIFYLLQSLAKLSRLEHGVVMHPCNPSTWEAKIGGSQVQPTLGNLVL